MQDSGGDHEEGDDKPQLKAARRIRALLLTTGEGDREFLVEIILGHLSLSMAPRLTCSSHAFLLPSVTDKSKTYHIWGKGESVFRLMARCRSSGGCFWSISNRRRTSLTCMTSPEFLEEHNEFPRFRICHALKMDTTSSVRRYSAAKLVLIPAELSASFEYLDPFVPGRKYNLEATFRSAPKGTRSDAFLIRAESFTTIPNHT